MSAASRENVIAGRYLVISEVAAGGMATVHLGRMLGPAGFSKVVALKRLHAHLAKEPNFVSMFLDEARLVAGIRHANVVPTLDVVQENGELVLVMEYVLGESVSGLLRGAKRGVPPEIATAIMANVLEGLHAAHEARAESGEPLGIVHRDVSPQNVLVGADGLARVLDFGIAKAAGRSQVTQDGQIKGKASYMAPEQVRGLAIDRRVDIYAAGVLLWEMLTGRRLFVGEDPLAVMLRVCQEAAPPPSRYVASLPRALDEVVSCALAKSPNDRFPTARAFADAIERAVVIAPARAVARWVDSVAHDTIASRAMQLELALTSATGVSTFPSAPPPARGASSPPDAHSNPPLAGASGPAEVGVDTTGVRARAHARAAKADTRARIRGALVGVGVVVLLASGFGLARLRALESDPIVPPASASAPPLPTAEEPDPPMVAAPGASGEGSVLDTIDPPSSASGGGAGGALERAPRRMKPAPKTSSAPSATPINCNPPWTLDDEGIRVLKPECQ